MERARLANAKRTEPWLRGVLPEHHLNAETKDLTKLGAGLVGTMAALLLGLLVASAKSSYDAQRGELTQMAATSIVLDRELAHYGPETAEVRGILKGAIGGFITQIWTDQTTPSGERTVPMAREVLFDEIQNLAPKTDAQKVIQSLCLLKTLSA